MYLDIVDIGKMLVKKTWAGVGYLTLIKKNGRVLDIQRLLKHFLGGL